MGPRSDGPDLVSGEIHAEEGRSVIPEGEGKGRAPDPAHDTGSGEP